MRALVQEQNKVCNWIFVGTELTNPERSRGAFSCVYVRVAFRRSHRCSDEFAVASNNAVTKAPNLHPMVVMVEKFSLAIGRSRSKENTVRCNRLVDGTSATA